MAGQRTEKRSDEMKYFLCLMLAFGLVACGDEDTADNGGSDAPMGEPCVDYPVTEAGQFCLMVKVPDDAPAAPEKISIHFFTSLPPAGPPNIMGAEISEASDLEAFAPGATVPVLIEGLPAEGAYSIYGNLYMPGGGAMTWQTVSGVDYVDTYSDDAIEFTGEAINLESPMEFALSE